MRRTQTATLLFVVALVAFHRSWVSCGRAGELTVALLERTWVSDGSVRCVFQLESDTGSDVIVASVEPSCSCVTVHRLRGNVVDVRVQIVEARRAQPGIVVIDQEGTTYYVPLPPRWWNA